MEAVEYFKQGYSCSESIIMYCIDKGICDESLLPIATAFSGGLGNGCLCGAVSGSVALLPATIDCSAILDPSPVLNFTVYLTGVVFLDAIA